MGSRFPSHQLSNGLYVSGRPEQSKERLVTMSSTAMPYTGGDIKKSGELGKMFDIPVDGSKSRKSGPVGNPPMRIGSFGGVASHSGPIMNSTSRASYSTSGPVTSGIGGGPTGGSNRQKSSSGPLNKHGDPIKKSSGPQSGGVTPAARQNSGSQAPVLPATGLITSGPITSGPLNSSGGPRKFSDPLDSMGSLKLHSTSIVNSQAVTNLSQEDDYSFKRNFPKPILWSVILLFVMGFIAGGIILAAVNNPILLVVVMVLFSFVAALFTWNNCWGERVSRVLSLNMLMLSLELQKMGSMSKSLGWLLVETYPSSHPSKGFQDAFTHVQAYMSIGDGIQRLPMLLTVVSPGDSGLWSYIKEGSTVSVMGVVQRNENVLMIVPPPEPLSTGCQWGKCILPASLEGIVDARIVQRSTSYLFNI